MSFKAKLSPCSNNTLTITKINNSNSVYLRVVSKSTISFLTIKKLIKISRLKIVLFVYDSEYSKDSKSICL